MVGKEPILEFLSHRYRQVALQFLSSLLVKLDLVFSCSGSLLSSDSDLFDLGIINDQNDVL
jgi:hypothetical protein